MAYTIDVLAIKAVIVTIQSQFKMPTYEINENMKAILYIDQRYYSNKLQSVNCIPISMNNKLLNKPWDCDEKICKVK